MLQAIDALCDDLDSVLRDRGLAETIAHPSAST